MPTAGSVVPPRVLIADPHPAFRGAATALLRTEGLDVVAEVDHGAGVVDLVRRLRPDIVLIGVSPYSRDGLELARRLAALPRAPAIVLMSSSPDDAPDPCDVGAVACLPKAGLTAAAVARAASRAERVTSRLAPRRANDWSTIR